MTNFNHVEDEFTRTVLEQPAQNTDRNTLSILLDEAGEHLNNDMMDDMIDFDVLDARAVALERANEAYLAGKNGTCHAYLRKYWGA
jgi:hypothetical protein